LNSVPEGPIRSNVKFHRGRCAPTPGAKAASLSQKDVVLDNLDDAVAAVGGEIPGSR
jgi:hypothetical protein